MRFDPAESKKKVHVSQHIHSISNEQPLKRIAIRNHTEDVATIKTTTTTISTENREKSEASEELPTEENIERNLGKFTFV